MLLSRRSLAAVLWLGLAAAAPSQTLRVLSYNLHHGEGVDRKIDLARLAGVIRAADVDVAALQELDQGTTRTAGVDQPAELARLTGMKVFFGRTIDHQGGKYGNAVLTRLPAALRRNHPLPGKEPRGLLEVRVKLQGARIDFFATHLDATRDDSERVAAARRILQVAGGKGPAILAGDMNSLPESEAMRLLEQAWTRAGAPRIFPTIPVAKPARQIDYVLYRPARRWRVREVTVLDEAVASDHRPILAVLELVR